MATTQVSAFTDGGGVTELLVATSSLRGPMTNLSHMSAYVTSLDDHTNGVVTMLDGATTAVDFKDPTVENRSAVSVLILIQFAIGWVGIIGNFLVLSVFISVRSKGRNQTNVLIIHQAFVDLLASTMLVLYSGHTIIGSPTSDNRFLKAFACFFWTRITLFALFAVSTFNLTLISVERYVATMWPLRYYRLFARKNLLCFIALVWIFGPICQYFVAFTTRSFRDDTCVRGRSPAWVGGPLFLWEYLIPVMIMAFSFTSIIKKLRSLERRVFGAASLDLTSTAVNVADHSIIATNHGTTSSGNAPLYSRQNISTSRHVSVIHAISVKPHSQLHPHPPPQLANRKTGGRSVRRRNATQSVLLVYFIYVLCWSPNQWAFFQLSLGGTLDFGGFFYQMSVVLAIFNTCVNPFIYAFRHNTYKAKLLESCRAMTRCRCQN